PGARHALDLGLAAELAVGADLAGDAGDLVGEARELVDHRVDRVLELEDLTLGVNGDLLGEVALRHGRGDLGDVADLVGEVVGHAVDGLGQAAPGAADALDFGLAADLAFGADLARDAGDLVGEARELVDHRVDRVLELEDLALRFGGDLLGEVALRDRGRDLRDVADLIGQVRGHEVDRLGQVLPGAADALDLGLAAELALGADLARDACDLGRERAQLLDHRVDRRADPEELALQRLAADVQRHLLREVAIGDRAEHARDLGGRPHEVVDQRVERVDPDAPGTAGAAERRPLGHPPLQADDLADADQLARH